MSMTDPIADMLTRIRNALIAKHDKVVIPVSKIKKQIAQILIDEGYINFFKIIKKDGKEMLKLYLKYVDDYESVVIGIKRVSKPGCRVYVAKDEIPVIRNGLGISILSTNMGVLSARSCKKMGVGGEIICQIW